MRIEYIYEKRYLLKPEYESNFEPHRKKNLSMIEKVGLQEIAVEFLCQYLIEITGEPVTSKTRQEIRDTIRWNDDNVDILDGVYDTFEFDGFLFGSLWMTDNGIPMLTAYELPEACINGEEEWTDYDWYSDFTPRLFRLN